MRRATVSILAAVAAIAVAAPWVHAEDYEPDKSDWPLSEIARPLTLAKSMLEIRGDTLIVNLSQDEVADPISLAPDVYFGINGRLTVGVTHATGICVSGDACVNAYDDVALEALYGLMRGGNLELALRGGVTFPKFDPFVGGLHVGAIARLRVSSVAVRAEPMLYVGVIERSEQKETLVMPVWLQVRLQEQLMAFLSTGIVGPLDSFGDFYEVPLGLGVSYALNNRIDVGAEFSFTDLLGQAGSVDGRRLVIRGALRL